MPPYQTKINPHQKGSLMFIAATTVIGNNLYDLVMKILGSEVMRSLFSYLIRQAMARFGL